MKTQRPQQIDARRAQQIVQEILARRPGYLPDWQPSPKGSDQALLWVFARYVESILQRLNQVPDKNKLAFLDLLGIDLIPAQSARTPVVFRLAEDAADGRAPQGTQVVAPPPPESTEQIVFETEQTVGLTAASIQQLFSLWPGRDQYSDHSAAFAAGEEIRPFQKRALQYTPHYIYIAHDTLLALSGKTRLHLTFELTQTSNEHLKMKWQYWDGKVWRGFRQSHADCDEAESAALDSTNGFTKSGRFLLESDCAEAVKTTVNGIEAFWIRGMLDEPLPPDPAQILPLVEEIKLHTEIERPLDPSVLQVTGDDQLKQAKFLTIDGAAGSSTADTVAVTGLEPDTALFAGEKLDTSQTFYPLGQVPKPGDTYYIASEEIFTKPGAEVTIYLELAKTPLDDMDISGVGTKTALVPKIAWEYWNGHKWQDLAVIPISSDSSSGLLPQNIQAGGAFKFVVRPDMSKVEVNGEEAFWIRARLVEKGFGFSAEVVWNDNLNSFTYIVNQPPAIANFRMGYAWQYGPFHPQKVFTYNDFQYEDHTEDAKWPGRVFPPFQLLRDVTPALYLGLSRKLPVDRLSFYFDITEEPGNTNGPAIVWEYYNGFIWNTFTTTDETNDLRVPGTLSFIGAADSREFARFGLPLHWVRARLQEDGPPGSFSLNTIYPNAVWASQQKTVAEEPVGTSNGQPDQLFQMRQVPILPGETIEVRELVGQQANVEWRILATELLGDDYSIIQSIEDELRREGQNVEVQRGNLRLRRDRNKRVTEAWVCWENRPHLYFSGPADRHYILEPNRGRLLFGNGDQGMVPPPGADIMVKHYRTGGGLAGNVAAESITQLLGGIGGIEQVFNPRPAEGGADGETVDALTERGPHTLRHRGRAITPQDYETMALEASPAVGVARAMATRDDNGRFRPGWVTLIIIPHSEAARPYPSFGLREQVRRYLAAHAPATIAAADQIVVTGPTYQEVDVTAVIVPTDPTQAGIVADKAQQALAHFFHPLFGGPEGRGWAPGRHIYQSDVASVLERVENVDYVKELSLLLNGTLQREVARVNGGHIAVAGKMTIRMMIDP